MQQAHSYNNKNCPAKRWFYKIEIKDLYSGIHGPLIYHSTLTYGKDYHLINRTQ